MKRFVCSLAALMLLAAPLCAVYDWEVLHYNYFWMAITNHGRLAQVQGGSDAFACWPLPPEWWGGMPPMGLPNYIYGWGPWIGAQVSSLTPGKTYDTLVTLGYNPSNSNYEFTPGAIIGGVPQDPNSPGARIYLSTDYDWPLKKYNGQDSVISMLDTRCAYNDWLASQHQAGGRPLKVEVTQTTYQWNVTGLQDIIFFLWEIKNTGDDTLRNVYIVPSTDCDIGNESGFYSNDLCGVDTAAGLAYQYQRDSTEEGWPRNAGCIGFCFLQGPVATKDFTFPDGFHISAGETLGLDVFKVFNIGTDAQTDIDQYRRMAGYNIQTGEFNRLDTCTNPGDYRFLMSTGPIDIPPGETVRAIVSVICADVDYSFLPGDPLSAVSALRQKAVYSRSAFLGMIQGTVQITLTSPLGGEVWSGSHDITWTYGGAAQPTDSVDIYYTRDGYAWDTVAVNLPNIGSYPWSTASVPDGVRYRICAFLHGQDRLACSYSQDFVIDNPGNGSPELITGLPGSTMTASYLWQWQAGDADGDQLAFNLYVQRQGGTAWAKAAGPISSDTCNTHVWRQYQCAWDTDTMPNGDYRLMVDCSDGSALVCDSVSYYFPLYNDHVHYAAGLDSGFSTLPFSWYLLNQANLTGHTYQARFKRPCRGAVPIQTVYPAEYAYDLWDVTTDSLLWAGRALSAFQSVPELYYYDQGDLVDGFVPTCGDTGFMPAVSAMDSALRPAGDPSVDTLKGEQITNPQDMGWAFLNTPLEIRWHVDGTHPNDTLHAKVWDVAYNVQIPLDTTRLDQLSTISWMFGGTGTIYGRSIITSGTSAVTRMYMNLCGYRLFFNNGVLAHQMTWATHPQEGDVWRLYFSGDIPPRLGDVFSFTPTGVAGGPGQPAIGRLTLSQNLPNPFARFTRIDYQLPKPGLVRLRVYNVAGQLVRTLVDGPQTAGPHAASWDGRDGNGRQASSGIYLYRLSAQGSNRTLKMTLIR